MTRHIILWRKTNNVLEWDHYVAEDAEGAGRVIENLKKLGVHQYHTYELGKQVKALSSEY